MKTHAARVIFLLCIFNHLFSFYSSAQKVNFGLYAEEGLSLIGGNTQELDFNLITPALTSGQVVVIQKISPAAAVFLVQGPADAEITVSFDSDPFLEYLQYQIPMKLRMAYYNKESIYENISEEEAKQSAIEVPAGVRSITFPMLRGAAAYTESKLSRKADKNQSVVTAYIIIYGSLGVVPPNAASGEYTGQININVESASLD